MQDLAALVDGFTRDGYAVVPAFVPKRAAYDLVASMDTLVDGWQPESSRHSVFHVNNEAGDARSDDATERDAYLIRSADQIAFFLEPGAINATTGAFTAGLPKTRMLNKVGHGLHIRDEAFRRYSESEPVARLVRALGYAAPRLVQSMFIFKQPRIGEEVTSHQDATFLHTAPRHTCLGLLLFLEDASLENGCLWARPGSHAEPLRHRWERDPEWFRRRAQNESTAGLSAMRMRQVVPPEESSSPASAALAATPDDPVGALRSAGYVPVPASAGDLLLVHGRVDHLSLPNRSPRSRHTFQLHLVEGAAGSAWSSANWAQYESMPRLNSKVFPPDQEPKSEL
jgi:phytanoyl-CoA hydroxylase